MLIRLFAEHRRGYDVRRAAQPAATSCWSTSCTTSRCTQGRRRSLRPSQYLSERVPATFVYAGIDLRGAGLFTGIRGRQIAGRFSVIQSLPFAYGTTAQRQEWRALVVSLEQSLRLHNHKPGTLLRHAADLYDRTSGMIGSLSHLLRGAAIEAIRNGTEKLTKPLLDTIPLDHHPLDHHAEQASTPPRRRPRRTARRA